MPRSLHREKSLATAVFFGILGAAILLFLPFVWYNRGYFIYYGDFNAQQIPFYQLAHQAIRSGNIGWNWNTDLGANFIGSYSFYLLGSPFFWITLPFPNAWVPYMMAPLLALKIAFAGLTAFAYTRRFLSQSLAGLAGFLYAFSGFSLYNIFFNHFHEAMIWFPLLLLGVEQYMTEGRRGLFAFAVVMTALSNYYFFIAQAIFVMIYWVLRALSGEWHRLGRRFFGLWFEALLGTAGAAVLLLPSFLTVIQNTRTGQLLEGWDFLIYSTEQRLYDIVHSFFFPPDIPARVTFFPEANNKWSSMTAWIPVFGCTGAIAYFQSRRHTDWLRRLLVLLVIFALIPGFNALFQLFNQVYYARWFYMLTLMLILATLRCFEGETPVEWKRALGWSGGITVAIALFIGLMPKSWTPDEETGRLQWGLSTSPVRFWVYVGIAVVCLLLTAWLIRTHRTNRQRFVACATTVCAFVCLAGGWAYLTFGKATSNYPDDYVIDKLIESNGFTLPDGDTFARIDTNKAMDNQGMYWGLPSIQAFHSIVPGSVMDFYRSIGVTRTVGSRPDASHYPLRSLLSTRWLFDYVQPADDVQLYFKEPEDYFELDGVGAMPGWTYYDTQDGFAIYENQHFIPMGFTYTHYIPQSAYEALTESSREQVLLHALVIPDDQVETITQALSLQPLDANALFYTYEEFAQACTDRAATAASYFKADGDRFSATITLDKENLVFFSVPHEDGWSATVNGQPAAIYRVNVGFMAVRCPAGEDISIQFTYKTPGLLLGARISGGALLLLLLYWMMAAITRPRRPQITPPALPPAGSASRTMPPRVTTLPDGFDLYAIYKPRSNTDSTTNKDEE